MFRHYLKTTYRNLYKDRLYAFINIAGLSLAATCCLIIALFVQNESGYDSHNAKSDRIFRLVTEIESEEGNRLLGVTAQPLGPLIMQDNAQIEDYVRFKNVLEGGYLLESGENGIYWEDVFYADPSVFDMFTFQILEGDPTSALVEPNTIAISKSFAETYWGQQSALGKLLSSGGTDYRVTLVYSDIPSNSHLKHNALISYSSYEMPFADSGLSYTLRASDQYTYLLLASGFAESDFVPISDAFYEKYSSELGNNRYSYKIEPLAEIHLYSQTLLDLSRGNILFLYALSIVGIFIFLIAVINYVNLATARSIRRVREVGLRKTLGANGGQLALQFIAESIFVTLLALFIGLSLAQFLLQSNSMYLLINNDLRLSNLLTPTNTVIVVLIACGTGLISGLYPAAYLSALQPAESLNQKGIKTIGSIRVRQLLLFFQFLISISVISSAMLMSSQMEYVDNRPLGYDSSNRLIVPITGFEFIRRLPALKSELLSHPGVIAVTDTDSLDGMGASNIRSFRVENNQGEKVDRVFSTNMVGLEYVSVMDMEIVAGREFNNAIATDRNSAVLVNEAGVRQMGWDNPIGKIITDGSGDREVVGVIKDFNFSDLTSEVAPYLLLTQNVVSFESFMTDESKRIIPWQIIIHVAEANLTSTLNFIETTLQEIDPSHVFSYRFLEDALNENYSASNNQVELVSVFAIVCILISTLGIFGLAALVSSQRTKEIGIRKILGASVARIIFMLSKSILFISLAAALISSFISYWAVSEWLEVFYYRAALNSITFLLAAAIVLLVAFTTIAAQSFRTAMANPIDALRYE